MTDPTEPRIFHARSTGLTLPEAGRAGGTPAGGRVLYQGETFEVTREVYDATKDRGGRSWLDLTPEEQVQRWGMQKFGPGPAPEDLKFAGDDEGVQYRRGLAAREEALKHSDPGSRALALKEVATEYGDALNPIAQGPQHIPARTGF